MEKLIDDQDLHLKLFENKMNSNLFKFLVREYFSNSMNPFLILKMLSKILFSNISKILKLKYILFFLTILKRLTISERLLKEHINPIITDTFEHILTRKADYVIILQYAIFLVQIGQADFALSRLQIFSTDLRFINNGELLFYRGLIDYMDLKTNKNFFSLFHKSLTLLKNNEKNYAEFIVDFLVSKNMTQELGELLRHDKIKEIFEKNDKKKFRLLNTIAESDFMDMSRKISILCEELNKNFTEFTVLLKFCDMVENFYEEKNINVISNTNRKNKKIVDNYDVDMESNENEIYKRNSTNFAEKVAFVGMKHLKIYIKFLSSYAIFDSFNLKCISLLEDALDYLKLNTDMVFDWKTKIEITDDPNLAQQSNESNNKNTKSHLLAIYGIIQENNKLFIEIILKQTITKEIIRMYKKKNKNAMAWNSNTSHETEKYSYDLGNIYNKWINLIDLNYEIINGYKLSELYQDVLLPFEKRNKTIDNWLNSQNVKDLLNWIKLIKNISIIDKQ